MNEAADDGAPKHFVLIIMTVLRIEKQLF